jgi:ankyrin repeat protein
MNNRRAFLTTTALGGVTGSLAFTLRSEAPIGEPVSEEPVTDIFQAAFKGDMPRATELAKLNPAVAQLRSSDGRTPLHFAAAGGHADMVFFLTQKGADLSAGRVSPGLDTPLIAAIDLPDHGAASDTASALLVNGSDPNARRADGKSALEIATARGYADIVELLVHRGAEPAGAVPAGAAAGGVPAAGATASAAVADGVKVERVYFGKRYSFDVDGRPYTQENLDGLPQDFINEFARLAHFDVERVKHLHKLAPALVYARATWDESAIEAASHMGLTPLARYLADHGAPVSTCTATLLGLRPRVEALVNVDPACVRERGAHDLPLMAYTAYGEEHYEIADFLLNAGANLHARAFGQTILHLAAGKGYLRLAETLLTHGADINAIAKVRGTDATPAAMAGAARQAKMSEFLKSRGGRV